MRLPAIEIPQSLLEDGKFIRSFWSRVKVRGPDECWPWMGWKAPTVSSGGVKTYYGKLFLDRGLKRGATRRVTTAHRMAFAIAKRIPRPTEDVCHSCDAPPCCNPAHLLGGDQSTNAKDRWRKGRRGLVPQGAAVWKAKLTRRQAAAIKRRRANGESLFVLAQEFGVSKTHVCRIARGKSWKRELEG